MSENMSENSENNDSSMQSILNFYFNATAEDRAVIDKFVEGIEFFFILLKILDAKIESEGIGKIDQ